MLSIAALLAKAKEKSPHVAADAIFALTERGWSQRKISAEIGRSTAWTSLLLAWRRGGYVGDPFGPAHHKERPLIQKPGEPERSAADRARLAAVEAATKKSDRKIVVDLFVRQADETKKVQDELKNTKNLLTLAESALKRAKSQGSVNPQVVISADDRDRLVKFLGMLGSDGQGEVENAWQMADKLRRKLGRSWSELIIAAGSS